MIKIKKIFLWIGIILIVIGAIGMWNIGVEEEITGRIIRIRTGFLFLFLAGIITSAGALTFKWK